MGVLVVWVRVCAVYWRNKAGGIAVRRRRRSSEAGKDGLGVAGSGSDAVGGTTGRLRSVCVPQRSSFPLAVSVITTVYFYISPLVSDQPMTPDGTVSLPTTSLVIGLPLLHFFHLHVGLHGRLGWLRFLYFPHMPRPYPCCRYPVY